MCPESKPHPITGETVPLTFGHEFSGVIEEVGEGVSERFKVGGRVVVAPIIYDGDCGACQDGLVNCCWKNGFVGLSGWGGGLSEHLVVRHTRGVTGTSAYRSSRYQNIHCTTVRTMLA